MSHEEPNPRRRFIGQLAVGATALTSAGACASAQGSTRAILPNGTESPHDAWMKQVPGNHRAFIHGFNPAGVLTLMAKNYIDVYHEAWGEPVDQLGVAVGVQAPAVTIVLNDAMWVKHGFGRLFNVTDPQTRQAAVHNQWATGSDTSVATLRGRGVVFLVCNTALRLSAAQWAPAVNMTPQAVHQELLANLLPGVIPVPAMVVTVSRAQEAGFSYLRGP